MNEITAITPQIKDKTRCNIFIDGRFYCGLTLETVIKNRLKVGQVADPAFLSQIQLESEKSVALDKALTHISATRKTEKQIRDFLSGKGYLPAVVDYVLEKMRGYNFLNDCEYAESYVSAVGGRKGELVEMSADDRGTTKLQFTIPARCLFGYRSEMLTDTKGFGIMSHVFAGYEEYKGDIPARTRGSLVVFETGVTTQYGLFNAQERCTLFLGAGEKVYEGQVVGENSRDEDLTVNVCKLKHLTNSRASGSDEALKLITPTVLSLEQCLEFIADDELVEVTPVSIRLRKKILSRDLRMKEWAKNRKND